MEQWGPDPEEGRPRPAPEVATPEMFRRPESSLIYFVIFALMVFAAVAASNVWLYRQFAGRLDHSLGLRLESAARASALFIDAESLTSGKTDAAGLNLDYIELILADRLESFVERFGVDEILILDSDFRVVYDSGETYLVGERYPHLDEDARAIQRALESDGAYSPTTRARRAYLKRGFAPVGDQPGGWTALVVVEADVDFFDLLRTWKRTLVTVTIGIAAVLALLTLLFLRLWSAGDRARRSLVRQDKLATLGRMVSQVAHEIRNPLGIIQMSAQRLRRSTDPSHDAKMVDYILAEARRLDGIVERYLDYARGQPLQRERVSTRKLVGEILAEVRRAETGPVRLIERVDGPDTVWVDRARLRQLLYNLIQNAIRAGAAEITVGVELDAAGREPVVRWTVEDDGSGIPPRQLKRVFEPFYSTRPEGSGLGLSIVQQIAEEHGGTVSIRSRPGEGTTVTVLVPDTADPTGGERDGQDSRDRR